MAIKRIKTISHILKARSAAGEELLVCGLGFSADVGRQIVRPRTCTRVTSLFRPQRKTSYLVHSSSWRCLAASSLSGCATRTRRSVACGPRSATSGSRCRCNWPRRQPPANRTQTASCSTPARARRCSWRLSCPKSPSESPARGEWMDVQKRLNQQFNTDITLEKLECGTERYLMFVFGL